MCCSRDNHSSLRSIWLILSQLIHTYSIAKSSTRNSFLQYYQHAQTDTGTESHLVISLRVTLAIEHSMWRIMEYRRQNKGLSVVSHRDPYLVLCYFWFTLMISVLSVSIPVHYSLPMILIYSQVEKILKLWKGQLTANCQIYHYGSKWTNCH